MIALDPLSPCYALACLAVAIAAASLLVKAVDHVDETMGRYATIDGLRGYLALSVFIHHGSVWFYWLRSGQWTAPPSRFYSHLGDTAVALFFMITGFLFFMRILDGKVDWLRLYVSRVLRLTPLFHFCVLVILAIVGASTHWRLQVPLWELVKSVVKWLLFFSTDVNGFSITGRITAGVTWTLPYEWTFYAVLPLIAALVSRPIKLAPMFVVVFGIFYFFILNLHLRYMAAFLGGMSAASLIRIPHFAFLAQRPASSILVAAGVAAVFCHEGSAFDALPLVLLSASFALMAGGADLFGALRARVSRLLGDVTYGMYLLHGPLLFFAFMFILGRQQAATLSVNEHWAVMLATTPCLVYLTYAAFRLIERPCILRADRATLFIRAGFRQIPNAAPVLDVIDQDAPVRN